MPMAHGLPFLPSGVSLSADAVVWVDVFASGEWTTYQTTAGAIAALATASGAQLNVENEFTKNQRVLPVVDPAASGSYNIDCSLSNNFELILAGNITLNLTNTEPGMVINIELKQPSGGGFTIGTSADFLFAGGTDPTWVTTAFSKNLISGYIDSDGDMVCGAVVGAA